MRKKILKGLIIVSMITVMTGCMQLFQPDKPAPGNGPETEVNPTPTPVVTATPEPDPAPQMAMMWNPVISDTNWSDFNSITKGSTIHIGAFEQGDTVNFIHFLIENKGTADLLLPGEDNNASTHNDVIDSNDTSLIQKIEKHFDSTISANQKIGFYFFPNAELPIGKYAVELIIPNNAGEAFTFTTTYDVVQSKAAGSISLVDVIQGNTYKIEENATFELGSVFAGSTNKRKFKLGVKNTYAAADLNISEITLSGDSCFSLLLQSMTSPLQPGFYTPFEVEVDPTNLINGQKYTTLLTAKSNDPDNPEYTITLEVTGAEEQKNLNIKVYNDTNDPLLTNDSNITRTVYTTENDGSKTTVWTDLITLSNSGNTDVTLGDLGNNTYLEMTTSSPAFLSIDKKLYTRITHYGTETSTTGLITLNKDAWHYMELKYNFEDVNATAGDIYTASFTIKSDDPTKTTFNFTLNVKIEDRPN